MDDYPKLLYLIRRTLYVLSIKWHNLEADLLLFWYYLLGSFKD